VHLQFVCVITLLNSSSYGEFYNHEATSTFSTENLGKKMDKINKNMTFSAPNLKWHYVGEKVLT